MSDQENNAPATLSERIDQIHLGTDLTPLTDKQLQERKAELSAIKKELTGKEKTPAHEEIERVYAGAKQEDRLNMDLELVKGAFKKTGNADFQLTKEGLVQDGEQFKFPHSKKTPEEPQIYYKQVYETKTVGSLFNRRQERVPTNEVLIVVDLNNGSKSSENTIVYIQTTQNNGKVALEKDTPLLARILSEKEFKAMESSKCEQSLKEGKITRAQYLSDFARENGRSLTKHWEEWDSSVTNNPDHWESNKHKAELMDRLSASYNGLLEQTQKDIKEVNKATKERIVKAAEKKAEIIASPEFQDLLLAVKYASDDKDAPLLRQRLSFMLRVFGIPEDVIKREAGI